MRRIAAFLVLAVCTALTAFAQKATRLPLVGVSNINTVASNEPIATIMRDALAALGDIDGKSIRLDFRLAESDAGRFPQLAEALVRDDSAVIVAHGPPAVRAAQGATQAIPIVASVNDLVASGFIESMARPGGNITGVSMLVSELDAKRLEVLKEILPSARRFGLLIETGARAPAVLQAVLDTARQISQGLVAPSMECPPADRLPDRLQRSWTSRGQERNAELTTVPDCRPRPELVAEEVKRLDRIVSPPVGILAVDELTSPRHWRSVSMPSREIEVVDLAAGANRNNGRGQ